MAVGGAGPGRSRCSRRCGWLRRGGWWRRGISSRKRSPAPRPLGIRLHVSGTSMSSFHDEHSRQAVERPGCGGAYIIATAERPADSYIGRSQGARGARDGSLPSVGRAARVGTRCCSYLWARVAPPVLVLAAVGVGPRSVVEVLVVVGDFIAVQPVDGHALVVCGVGGGRVVPGVHVGGAAEDLEGRVVALDVGVACAGGGLDEGIVVGDVGGGGVTRGGGTEKQPEPVARDEAAGYQAPVGGDRRLRVLLLCVLLLRD